MIRMELHGFEEARAMLFRLERVIARPELGDIWRQLVAALRKYPPPPPGSRYKRTGRLGAGWMAITSQTGASGALITVVNGVAYAPYVMGTPAEQAAIHKGRWQSAVDILNKFVPAIIREWERAINRAAGR